MTRFAGLAAVLGTLILPLAAHAQAEDPFKNFRPVTDAMLAKPDPADWPMWRRTLNNWGYSPLDQITRRNVDQLRLVWTRPLANGDQEGTPLVHDGILYFPNPGDVTQAFVAATGEYLWEYRRSMPSDVGNYFPAATTNRNLAIYDNLILDNGADGWAYALDAKTGKLVWETQIMDYRHGAKNSSGPIVADGKVISGRSCEPEGGPEACVITAFDAKTGKEVWRHRTIPKPGEPGDESWGGIPYEQRWHVGMWMVPSYDPTTKRVYVGTSVTAPAPKFMLAGNKNQYLYHNSTLALDVNTGNMIWYFQHVVDSWDLDHPFERLIVDTDVAPDPSAVKWINPSVHGEQHRVITGIPGKTGLVYTLDAATGKFLWARETTPQNVISDINKESGAATVNPDKEFTAPGQEKLICPSTSGGKNYPSGTYSPDTGMMYYPLQNTCMMETSGERTLDPNDNSLYRFSSKIQISPGETNVGTLQAINVSTGKTEWKFEQRAGMLSLMSTGGGLVFGGDVNGHFRAYDQKNGQILWDINLGAPVNGYPATFAVGGKQYVAISTGGSGLAFGLARLSPELHPGSGNQLFVFALP
jgi:PQQ-dependent dehydrogenase (methanol/ethanol family)